MRAQFLPDAFGKQTHRQRILEDPRRPIECLMDGALDRHSLRRAAGLTFDHDSIVLFGTPCRGATRPRSTVNAGARVMKTNHVSHFENYANDPKKIGQFYTSLFDWKLEPMPNMDYTVVNTVDTDEQRHPVTPGAINGGMIKRPDGFTPRAWVNYVNVESVDDTVTRAKTLGAHVSKPKSAVPGMGWFAMMTDPEGNEFAVWQPDKQAR
jgi:predicted enzyme related to lactoylglutathione lyase